MHCEELELPANSLKNCYAFSRRIVPATHIVRKNILSNGVLVAESLVKVTKTGEFTILLLNPNEEDIVILENTILTTLEKVEDKEIEIEVLCSTVNEEINEASKKGINSWDSFMNKPAVMETNIIQGSLHEADVPENVMVNNVNKEESKGTRRPLTREDVNCTHQEYAPKLTKLLNNFRDVITLNDEAIGVTNIARHEIVLSPDAPVLNLTPYRIPHKYRQELEEVNEKMLNDGIIEPSTSLFNFPVIVVKKKYGEVRPGIDYRSLNKVVAVEAYPLLRIDEILYNLGGNHFFSSLDLRSAFHNVELADNCKQYTAYSVNFRKYQLRRLPFGLRNSPAVLQAIMCAALANVLGKICLYFSTTF